jgi:outer membrane protein assembly factor BamB
MDVLRCLAASDGTERWTFRNLAEGNLDYGNSSRATPLIDGDLVFFASATGQFHALDIKSGEVRWKKDLRAEFGVTAELPWGFCTSPLLVDGRLIVMPGGPEASIVALNPATGDIIWKTPGSPPGYGSPIVATLGGRKQIVGHDKDSLGGWDVASGERLWKLTPSRKGDFNVPTPIVWRDHLIISTENNGTRLHNFNSDGTIDPKPLARDEYLVPDTHTPVVVNDRLFGVQGELFIFDLTRGMTSIATSDDQIFAEHTSLIASQSRILTTTLRGELVLIDATAADLKHASRLKLFDGEEGLYSHPALVGTRLYVRGTTHLVCLELKVP